MIKERGLGCKSIKLIIELILIEVSFYGWFIICKKVINIADLNSIRYSVYAATIGFSFIVKSSFGTRLVSGRGWLVWFAASKKAVVDSGFVAFCLFLLLIGLKDVSVSRFFLLIYFQVMGVLLMLSEVYAVRLISFFLFRNTRVIRTLIVGEGLDDNVFSNWIQNQSLFGMQVVGRISLVSIDSGGSGGCESIDIGEIIRHLDRLRANQIIISDLMLGQDTVRRLSGICDNKGARIIFKFSSDKLFGGLASVNEEDGLSFAFRESEPLEDPFFRIVKRLMDLVVAIPMVVFIIPLASIVVWVLQQHDSPGPVFYTQLRCGINNVPFKIFKYRTMHVGGYDASRQAGINDARVSRYGRWLRKTSIDELPQFINVLKGNMSVVGPRPHLEAHNLKWAELLNEYQKRSYVKPGITGLAQVRGLRGEARSAEDICLRVKSDIEYIANWSFWLDIKIIMKTVVVVFFPPKTAV